MGKQPVEQPFMVFLGGQPGADKGNVYKKYTEEITDNFVSDNCDDFRQYHPNFEQLFRKYGDNDSDYTQDFVNKINIRLVDELSKSRYNIRASLKTRLIKEKADRYGSRKETFRRRAVALQGRLTQQMPYIGVFLKRGF